MKILSLIIVLLTITASVAGQAVLPIANSDRYTTDALYVKSDVPLAYLAPPCINVGLPNAHGLEVLLPTGGVAKVDNPGEQLCGGNFFTFPAPNDQSFVHVRFNDGVTKQSYYIPALGSVVLGHPVVISPISTEKVSTCLVFFPTVAASVTATVSDGLGRVAGSESFSVSPPVYQFCLSTQVHEGSVSLSTGDLGGIGLGGGVGPNAPIPCFATLSDKDGGNALILPCK